ncbi:uncharacterized protein F4822DRAFT_97923 [Hypoxylon trugodes]|uniref:uncharacterized protein n=1 Tax=Hypoxylon trugodes TaxID=326681 RepID=UPI00219DD7E2|nr:uncharacterized protein F4822DRAFT_97923 [Hypoxylon trugodes]KAI1382825.1 hypothetical protein F4822DRAFT_97923 [Hypoxylon trugodes]
MPSSCLVNGGRGSLPTSFVSSLSHKVSTYICTDQFLYGTPHTSNTTSIHRIACGNILGLVLRTWPTTHGKVSLVEWDEGKGEGNFSCFLPRRPRDNATHHLDRVLGPRRIVVHISLLNRCLGPCVFDIVYHSMYSTLRTRLFVAFLNVSLLWSTTPTSNLYLAHGSYPGSSYCLFLFVNFLIQKASPLPVPIIMCIVLIYPRHAITMIPRDKQ